MTDKEKTLSEKYIDLWLSLGALTDITADNGKHVIIKLLNTVNDIVATALSKLLPFMAPLPSALNLKSILISKYNYPAWQGWIAAGLIEFLAFVIAEIAIKTLLDKSTRTIEKGLTGCLLIAYYIALFSVVFLLEVFHAELPNYVALLFPVFSVIATINYGYIRWKNPGNSVEYGAEMIRKRNAATQQKPPAMETETRRKLVLQCFGNSIVGNAEISEAISGKRPTVSKDAKWLREQGYLKKTTVTETGWQWLNNGEPAIHSNGMHA